MVNPRIYRAGLVIVAVALIVGAFSLQSAPSGMTTTLAAPVGGGPSPYATMVTLARRFPDRSPGSADDQALAGEVASQFRSDHLAVSTSEFPATTASGQETLTQVVGWRTGVTPGTIVIVAHRDGAGSPAIADLSGTAVLLSLAHDLSGETLGHSVMLVSTSGSVGAAGAARLAGTLSAGSVDAVIVLGDLAAADPTEPVVLPWSDSPVLAPPLLRATVGGYVRTSMGISPGGPSLPAQLAHLAYPLTFGEQGPFGAQGIPAVLLSLSGNRLPSVDEALSPAHIDALAGAIVQVIGALDQGARVPAPSAYLELGDQLVPLWAIRMFVLALILPVGLATLDGLARARRRGHSLLRWLGWVLASVAPFLVALGALLLVRVTSLLPAAPPGPVPDGTVALSGAGIAVIIVCALVLLGGLFLLRPACVRLAAARGSRRVRPSSPAGDAAGVALSAVACLVALITWVFNPFCALLLVPALHLWLWLSQPSLRSNRVAAIALAGLGILPALGLWALYVHALGFSAVGTVWAAVLLVAGGQTTSVVGIFWSFLAGLVVAAVILAARARDGEAPMPAGVTLRGPSSYAGPGSLGGTESALGSRR